MIHDILSSSIFCLISLCFYLLLSLVLVLSRPPFPPLPSDTHGLFDVLFEILAHLFVLFFALLPSDTYLHNVPLSFLIKSGAYSLLLNIRLM